MEETKNRLIKHNSIARQHISIWLYACCFMVIIMVIVGGSTRLTGSGLSMVNWHPIHGIIPPLNSAEWLEEFNNYRQSPEYQKINYGMELSEFKVIFAFEYIHRILGRITGLLFVLPFFYFLYKKTFERHITLRLFLIAFLFALQGLIGWYMVKSGLIDNPHVSQYRLALHLSTAVLLLGLLFWTALDFSIRSSKCANWRIAKPSICISTLIFLQIVSGAFVAGLKAGLVYNSFPLMGEHLIPPEVFSSQPLYLDLLENPVTVQFLHRLLALTIFSVILYFWFISCFKKPSLPKKIQLIYHLLFITLLIQISIGISTLLLHVPVILAVIHQLVAIILFSISLYLSYVVLYCSLSHQGPR